MAQKVTVQLVDDLDGTTSSDISTVTFGLDGVTYEIDLTEANAAELRGSLQLFVRPARRLGGPARRTTPVAPPAVVDREQNQAVREWAKLNGHDVSGRGRISKAVVEAFEAAH